MKLCKKHSCYIAKRIPIRGCNDCASMYVEINEFKLAYKKMGTQRAVVDYLSWTMRRVQDAYRFAVKYGHIPPARAGGHLGGLSHEDRKVALDTPPPAVAGRLRAPATPKAKRGNKVRRFLLSCAQNNTNLHEPLWENLQALAKEYDAEIILARLVYNRFARASQMDKKLIIEKDPRKKVNREYIWDERLAPYFKDHRLELAPGLVWCGELNFIPTAANPLTGIEGYTGRASCIVPHTRIAMRSVCSLPSEGTKFMYTTGTVTQRNYIQRKAGQLAEFHHCYAALLVEVDKDGTWFCRQINADSEGTLHDLDVKVEKGHVSRDNSVKAINWGDIHDAYRDRVASKLAWGPGGILDILRPDYQIMNDLIDFRVRNPHNIVHKLSGAAFLEWVKGHISVEQEIEDAATFLVMASRPDCETVVVYDNHSNFLVRWITQTGDFRNDPDNAVYFLEAALHYWRETKKNGRHPNLPKWGLRRALRGLPPLKGALRFLDEDESFILCPEAHGGIECGLHGHEGFNGARGGPTAFAKLGRKINAGHIHSAGIWDGAYFAGIMGLLKQGYNTGLGSWSQSNIITYPNGKRSIFTLYDGKWRA